MNGGLVPLNPVAQCSIALFRAREIQVFFFLTFWKKYFSNIFDPRLFESGLVKLMAVEDLLHLHMEKGL